MAGISVFQDSPESLKTLQYGSDGTTAKVLKTDPSGRQIIATEVGAEIEVTATDLDIRNLSNTQDNIVVYGNDGADNQILKTDATGRQIVTTEVGAEVAVTAADLDIRNLSNTQDNIVVYGNDGADNRALKTDVTGILQVAYTKVFTNQSQAVTTANAYTGSTERDISLQNLYTFFIGNTGANSATVKVQISPDNTLWIDDSTEFEVDAAGAVAVTPNKFANYARISYKSTVADSNTTLDVIFQAQS